MPLSKSFPKSPYALLDPADRWVPDLDQEGFFDILIPPLVQKLREEVKKFRDSNYEGASETSKSLLQWWFHQEHDGFRYYFAQQEAMETIIYLYDVAKTRHPNDLLQFDNLGRLTEASFEEEWLRFVIKMATGSGKTKIVSLAIVWSYFHKLYETDSTLARNFLVIAPNIIVLDRLYRDFKDEAIFREDPSLPSNGWADKNWKNDFIVKIHKQDNVNAIRKTGNIFLTNIHRIYVGKEKTNSDDFSMDSFLNPRPKKDPKKSKIDLAEIIKDLDELMVFNDEAHHIHEKKLQWHKSIEDIHYAMLQDGKRISLQIDTSATPKTAKGAIFPQIISDYPLVEAIAQKIVKQPIIPNKKSQRKILEQKSSRYIDRYKNFIKLGVTEWEKASDVHKKVGKKAILFIMTDYTENCDEVKDYLEKKPHLKGKVLVIHTNKQGDVKESDSNKKELNRLRDLANKIDDIDSPYEIVISVLMLKEGWDVRNVTTIVGLRAYSSKGNILPEQTLGRGLRLMYPEQTKTGEEVTVIGTERFMEFIEEIKKEGVRLEEREMGEDTPANAPTYIAIDKHNEEKDIKAMDIKLPILSPRIRRDYNELQNMKPQNLLKNKIKYKETTETTIEIEMEGLVDEEIKRTTTINAFDSIDYRPYLHDCANRALEDLNLHQSPTRFNMVYGHLKEFVQQHLFDREIDLDDSKTIFTTLANIYKLNTREIIIDTLKDAINEITITDKDSLNVKGYISIIDTPTFLREKPELHDLSFMPKKSVFNRIIPDNKFEKKFAEYLDNCPDIISFVKNYPQIKFKLEYVKHDGNIADYITDFIVKLPDNQVYIIETKGAEYANDAPKWKRLQQWCEDANKAQNETKFSCLYIEQEQFEKSTLYGFEALIEHFTGHQPSAI